MLSGNLSNNIDDFTIGYESGGSSDNTPPAAITDLGASSPTENSINLSWSAVGDDGMDGNNGFNGIAGGETHNGVLNCDLDANGHGGIGADSVGIGIRVGGAGGNGGRGGYDEFSLFCSGETGFTGENGGNGNTPGGSNAGTGGHRASACIPGDAVVGETGQDGQDGISYLIPATTNYDYSNYIWVPAYGLNGGDGYGGGGGQGGGGSSGQGTGILPFCLPGRGNGGGGGGSGGEGATGGQGGGGGGSTFGIYVSGTGTGTITSSIVVVPITSPVLGGAGSVGGVGGNGGAGGLGDMNCQSENGAGADGGNGGKGGDGGRGQDGAQGIIIPIAIGGTAVLNGLSTAIPHPTEITVNYNNFRGCTYSEIEMSKLDGLWTLPTNGHLINDINPVTSSYSLLYDSIITYFDSTGTYTLGANNGDFDFFVRITDDRMLPQIIINTSPACFDSIIYLTADLLALEYDWLLYATHPDSFIFSSNVPAPQLTGLDEGTYIVTLRQRDVCCGWSIPVFSTLIVLPELTPGIIGNTDTICYGATPNTLINIQTASGGTGGTPQYQWQMSTTSDTAGVGQWTNILGAQSESYQPTNLFETTHFVRQFTDSCGLKYSNVVTIFVLPELQGGTIGTDTTICENTIPDEFFSISDASGGSGSTVNYQWYYSTTTNIPGTLGWNSIISATANTYQSGALTQTTFFVREATDSCNTVYSNVITIFVDSMPLIDAGISQQLCGVLDFTLNAVLNNGNGFWYQLTGSGNSIFTPGNQVAQPDVHVDQYGIYEYIWVVTNGVCSDSASTTVDLHPNLTLVVNPADTTICEGDSVILNVSGGTYYLWQPSLSLSSDTGQSVNAYPITTTQYTITATDNNACTGSAVINIQVDDIPTVDAGNDIELCGLLAFGLHASTSSGSGSWLLVSGTGNAVYNPSNQVSNPTVSVDSYGHYTFLWTAINGICSDTSSVLVNLYPNPAISIQPLNPSVCEGSSITLVASGAETYTWTPATYLSTTTGDVVIATPNNDITYSVNGTSDEGCTSNVNISIIVHEYPIVNLGDSLYFCSSPDIVIDAGGGYQHYIWQDGSTNSTIQVTQAGTYWVVVDNHGCLTKDSIEIKPCIDIMLPNVFTPNGDGINDFFYAEGNFLEYFNITIFNRWGKLVFEAHDISACWDGTFNGIEATEGTYYWVVTYKSKSYLAKDKEIQLKGWLNLLR